MSLHSLGLNSEFSVFIDGAKYRFGSIETNGNDFRKVAALEQVFCPKTK